MTNHIVTNIRGNGARLFHSTEPEILHDGPAGTGKSTTALFKARFLAETHEGCRILLTRGTRASMSNSTLVTLEEKVLEPGHPALLGASGRRTLRQSRDVYRFPNGSEIAVIGLDNSERVLSADYDLIIVDEATERTITEEDWNRLLSRLRNGRLQDKSGKTWHQIIAVTNPASPQHWLKRRSALGKMQRIISLHQDNPALHDGTDWTEHGRDYITRLQSMTGLERDRRYLGKWVGAEGMVYSDWDRSTHVVRRSEIPVEWRRFRAIDFGYTNPSVCQWWAVDHDDRMYLYRELVVVKTITEDFAAAIRHHSHGERISVTVADSGAAEDRATLHKYGVPSTTVNKDIRLGIEVVQRQMRVQGDGKPRLMVFEDSLVERRGEAAKLTSPVGFANEVESYVWAESREGVAEKEAPVKVHDHSMDAARYAAVLLNNGRVYGASNTAPMPTTAPRTWPSITRGIPFFTKNGTRDVLRDLGGHRANEGHW